MITAAQKALITRACEQLKMDPTELGRHLVETSGAATVDDLDREGFERLMDRFTILMFRDRRRPILSDKTRKLLAAANALLRFSPHVIASELRFHGRVGNPRDLTGLGLLRMLTSLEQHSLDVSAFNDERRTVTPSDVTLFVDAVRDIAGEAGLSTVLGLRGGSEIGVPAFARPDHWLTEALGLPNASKVCERLRVSNADGRAVGGLRFYLPSHSGGAIATFVARKKAEADTLLLAGKSIPEVVAATGLSDRTVKRLRRRERVKMQRLQSMSASARRSSE